MFKFNVNYFLIAIVLFITEALIAAFMHDNFIRPWFGDYLVVMLIYCFIRAFMAIPVMPAALFVLLLSYGIEMAQYFNVLDVLGLRNSATANLVLGNYFSWTDILAYSLGVATLIAIEKYRHKTLILL